MLRLIISCSRSWNFGWHPLWRSTIDSKNIVKLLVTSQTIHIVCCENDYFVKEKFKLFNNNPFPNFLGPLVQNKVKCSAFYMEWFFILMQVNLIFTREVVHLASFWKWGFWNSKVAYLFHTMYLVFPKRLFPIDALFAVRYLWVVCHEDKCCVVTLARLYAYVTNECILSFD